MNEREPGDTFAPDQLGWLDFETRSPTDIRAGTYAYATDADAIICSYAISDGPVRSVAVPVFPAALHWESMPLALQEHHARVIAGEAKWAAWNAGFDRAVWNYSTIGFPEMQPEHIIDVMAQAVASGLPPDLSMAAQIAGGGAKKDKAGSELIALFCTPKGLRGVNGTPQSHAGQWAQFRDGYAVADVEAMRAVFRGTRQLPLAEWREYWAMEAINQRGIGIDLALVEAAAKLAEEDKTRSRGELAALTDGVVTSVDHVARIVAWLLPRLPAEGRAILTKREEEVDEEGTITRPAKHQLTRKRIERLIAFVNGPEMGHLDTGIDRVLQIRRYGGSKTPAKFARMLSQHTDGILRGQYVFNGAAQTGRASSKGVQIHNLARDSLKHEADLIIAATDGISYDQFSSVGDDTPVARKLSLLIRPAFVPQVDNVFVWSDWAQIEARVLPWLCDHMPGARERLEIFRAVDADPSVPDIYTRTAAQLSGLSIAEVTKPIRQRGKVAELALGFCGGVGALQAMAAGYGMHFSDEEAQKIVDSWRAANPWAQAFSRELWEAMRAAMANPHDYFKAGRVGFCFLPGYLGGSLLCELPSGRCLTYRAIRWQDVDVLDEDDKPTGQKQKEMMYSRAYGRVKLWPGVLVENFTQATAADILRGTLERLHDNEAADWMPVRLHTHDEILCECTVADADAAEHELKWVMREGFDWSKGLPIMSEETIAYYYTKDEGGHGL